MINNWLAAALLVGVLLLVDGCNRYPVLPHEHEEPIMWLPPEAGDSWDEIWQEWPMDFPQNYGQGVELWRQRGSDDFVRRFSLEENYDWKHASVLQGLQVFSRGGSLAKRGDEKHLVDWQLHHIRSADGMTVCTFTVWSWRQFGLAPSKRLVRRIGCFPTEERVDALEARIAVLETKLGANERPGERETGN